MSDLINRQDAIDAVKTLPTVDALKVISEMPSAQPEIIQCKDCVYWRTPENANYYCDHDFAGLNCVPMPDDFCSYAELRESEGKCEKN